MHNKITALIPTYQRAKFLRRAIFSVLQQTYDNLQVSVFDNASEDDTEKMVRELMQNDKRIFYIRHATNIGALKNFRYAFQSINTPYFSILGDDDALSYDFYEHAAQILDQNPDILFVIFNTLSIDEKADLIAGGQSTQAITFYRGKDRLNALVPSTWTGMLFRKEVAKIYLDMDDRYDIATDMRFLIHAKARYHFAYFSGIGAFFTCHSHAISMNRKRFDIVHYVIQLSRYVEIYHDKEINNEFKHHAVISIKEMLTPSIRKSFRVFVDTLRFSVKNICDNITVTDLYLHEEIQDAKNARCYFSAMILFILNKNKTIRSGIKFLFSRYYKKNKLQQKLEMSALQNGVYKKYFDALKAIHV